MLPGSQSLPEWPGHVHIGCLCSRTAKKCLDFSPLFQMGFFVKIFPEGTGTTCQQWASGTYFVNSHCVLMQEAFPRESLTLLVSQEACQCRRERLDS